MARFSKKVAEEVAILDDEELTKLCESTIVIPISAIPAQRFQCVLNGQNCTISIKRRTEYCYFSLTVNGTPIAENTICLCGNNLIPNATQFVGSIFFIDMNGHFSTPKYDEFGKRYRLVYVPFDVNKMV